MNRHPAIVQLWHPQALSSSPPWIVHKCVKYALIAYMQSWLPTRCRTQHFKITVGIESVKIAEIIPILVFLIFPRPQLKDCPRLILSKVFCARFLQFMFIQLISVALLRFVCFFLQLKPSHFLVFVCFRNICACFLFWHLLVSGPHPGGAEQVAIYRWWNLGKNHRLGEK